MSKDFKINHEEANKRHWDAIVRNFPLANYSLVLTIKGTSVGHQKNMVDLSKAIDRLGVYKGVIVGSVESFDHIQVLNEGKMAQVGWIREERITLGLALPIIFNRQILTIRASFARALRWISSRLKKTKVDPVKYSPDGGVQLPNEFANEVIKAVGGQEDVGNT